MKPERHGRVRCSAWLGRVIASIVCASLPGAFRMARRCSRRNRGRKCDTRIALQSANVTAPESNAVAREWPRNSVGILESARLEDSKRAAGIRVPFADRLEVAGAWPDIDNPVQIAISKYSQGPQLLPIALLLLGVPGTILLEILPIPTELRTWLWRLWIAGSFLWFLSIPLFVRVPCVERPNDPSSATRPTGGAS